MAAFDDVVYRYTYYNYNGDRYSGYGYADELTGYYPGQWIADSSGWYNIESVEYYNWDYNAQNLVYVESYYDSSRDRYAPRVSGGGYNGLGSEAGNAYRWDYANYQTSSFGSNFFGGKNQADLGGTFDDVYVRFTFYYADSNDYYRGYGYDEEASGMYEGLWAPYNNGYYYIEYTYNYGADYGLQDQVYINDYYDGNTGLNASYIGQTSYGPWSDEAGYAYNFNYSNWQSAYFDTNISANLF